MLFFSVFLTSCASTYVSSNSAIKVVYPHESSLDLTDAAVILGSQKISSSGNSVAVAKLVVSNSRGSTRPFFSQTLASGTQDITIFIANNFQFITAETQLEVSKGKTYFVNFSFAYPSQVLRIGEIWITDEKGNKVKEIKSWSQERSFGQTFGPNIA